MAWFLWKWGINSNGRWSFEAVFDCRSWARLQFFIQGRSVASLPLKIAARVSLWIILVQVAKNGWVANWLDQTINLLLVKFSATIPSGEYQTRFQSYALLPCLQLLGSITGRLRFSPPKWIWRSLWHKIELPLWCNIWIDKWTNVYTFFQ